MAINVAEIKCIAPVQFEFFEESKSKKWLDSFFFFLAKDSFFFFSFSCTE